MKRNVESVSILAVGANVFLFLIKLVVGVISGSYSVLADAVNSGSDIFASAINYVGIKISKKPSDEKHPYGHQKYEVLVGLVVTLVIFGSAIYIIYEAVRGVFNPEPLTMSIVAIVVMVISAGTNEVMARLKIKTGKEFNSIALQADGVHSRIDVLSSLAVVVGLVLTNYWVYADAVVALLVGLWILKESLSLGKEAADNLLDVSADKEKEQEVKDIVKEKKLELWDIKTQKRGSKFSANLMVKLPGEWKVEDATKTTEGLKKELLDRIEELDYVTISIDGAHGGTASYRGFAFGGRGYGWRRSKKEYCMCPKCGYKVEHKPGVPCKDETCPKCDVKMMREDVARSELEEGKK